MSELCRVKREIDIIFDLYYMLEARHYKLKSIQVLLCSFREKKKSKNFIRRLSGNLNFFFPLWAPCSLAEQIRFLRNFNEFSLSSSFFNLFSSSSFLGVEFRTHPRSVDRSNAIRVYRVGQTRQDTSSALFGRSIRSASMTLYDT